MEKKEQIIREGVSYLENFNTLKVNTSHPMVYSSALGIFMLSLMIVFFTYFNTYVAPGEALFRILPEEENSRFPGFLVLPMVFIIGFLFCAFKLSIQGRKFSTYKALSTLFRLSKHNDTQLWADFWVGKNNGFKFISMLRNIHIPANEFNHISMQQSYQDIISKETHDIQHDEFENFINLLYDDYCEDNKNKSLSQNAIFSDGSREQSEQANKFKQTALQSKYTFDYSDSKFFTNLPAKLIRITNAIPFAILFFYVFFFTTSLFFWKTPEFKNQILLFEITLYTSLFFAMIYSLFSFWFLRRTEEWRIYWKKYGLDFLLQFHNQGSSKIFPFLMPSSNLYQPYQYYYIFDACKCLPLSSFYNDNRHMFFDNSQYQYIKLVSTLHHIYETNSLKKEVVLRETRTNVNC